jgi:hypothetical protein
MPRFGHQAESLVPKRAFLSSCLEDKWYFLDYLLAWHGALNPKDGHIMVCTHFLVGVCTLSCQQSTATCKAAAVQFKDVPATVSVSACQRLFEGCLAVLKDSAMANHAAQPVQALANTFPPSFFWSYCI